MAEEARSGSAGVLFYGIGCLLGVCRSHSRRNTHQVGIFDVIIADVGRLEFGLEGAAAVAIGHGDGEDTIHGDGTGEPGVDGDEDSGFHAGIGLVGPAVPVFVVAAMVVAEPKPASPRTFASTLGKG